MKYDDCSHCGEHTFKVILKERKVSGFISHIELECAHCGLWCGEGRLEQFPGKNMRVGA